MPTRKSKRQSGSGKAPAKNDFISQLENAENAKDAVTVLKAVVRFLEPLEDPDAALQAGTIAVSPKTGRFVKTTLRMYNDLGATTELAMIMSDTIFRLLVINDDADAVLGECTHADLQICHNMFLAVLAVCRKPKGSAYKQALPIIQRYLDMCGMAIAKYREPSNEQEAEETRMNVTRFVDTIMTVLKVDHDKAEGRLFSNILLQGATELIDGTNAQMFVNHFCRVIATHMEDPEQEVSRVMSAVNKVVTQCKDKLDIGWYEFLGIFFKSVGETKDRKKQKRKIDEMTRIVHFMLAHHEDAVQMMLSSLSQALKGGAGADLRAKNANVPAGYAISPVRETAMELWGNVCALPLENFEIGDLDVSQGTYGGVSVDYISLAADLSLKGSMRHSVLANVLGSLKNDSAAFTSPAAINVMLRVSEKSLDERCRGTAALCLLSLVMKDWVTEEKELSWSAKTRTLLRQTVIQRLKDKRANVRNTVGSAVAEYMQTLVTWDIDEFQEADGVVPLQWLCAALMTYLFYIQDHSRKRNTTQVLCRAFERLHDVQKEEWLSDLIVEGLAAHEHARQYFTGFCRQSLAIRAQLRKVLTSLEHVISADEVSYQSELGALAHKAEMDKEMRMALDEFLRQERHAELLTKLEEAEEKDVSNPLAEVTTEDLDEDEASMWFFIKSLRMTWLYPFSIATCIENGLVQKNVEDATVADLLSEFVWRMAEIDRSLVSGPQFLKLSTTYLKDSIESATPAKKSSRKGSRKKHKSVRTETMAPLNVPLLRCLALVHTNNRNNKQVKNLRDVCWDVLFDDATPVHSQKLLSKALYTALADSAMAEDLLNTGLEKMETADGNVKQAMTGLLVLSKGARYRIRDFMQVYQQAVVQFVVPGLTKSVHADGFFPRQIDYEQKHIDYESEKMSSTALPPLRVEALKLMTNILRGNDKETVHETVRISILRLLRACIEGHGELCRLKDTPVHLRRHLRLTAAKGVIKAQTSSAVRSQMNLDYMFAIANVLQDDSIYVRETFVNVLRQQTRHCPVAFDVMPCIVAFNSDSGKYSNIMVQSARATLKQSLALKRARWMSMNSNVGSALLVLPENGLQFLLVLLAKEASKRSLDLTQPKDLREMEDPLMFFIEAVLSTKEHSIEFMQTVLTTILKNFSAKDDTLDNNLYILCALTSALIQYTASTSTTMTQARWELMPKAGVSGTYFKRRETTLTVVDMPSLPSGYEVRRDRAAYEPETPEKSTQESPAQASVAVPMDTEESTPAAAAFETQVSQVEISETPAAASSSAPTPTSAVSDRAARAARRRQTIEESMELEEEEQQEAPEETQEARSSERSTRRSSLRRANDSKRSRSTRKRSASESDDENPQESFDPASSSSPASVVPAKRSRRVLGEISVNTMNTTAKSTPITGKRRNIIRGDSGRRASTRARR
eukprot:Clim_evm64s22 gene=Clim_evmTU64s22